MSYRHMTSASVTPTPPLGQTETETVVPELLAWAFSRNYTILLRTQTLQIAARCIGNFRKILDQFKSDADHL
jgi:hypothetical protein